MFGILAFFKGIKISEGVWKYLAIALALAGLVGGGYYAGNNHGMSKGFDKGVESQKSIISEKDTTIGNLTDRLNTEHKSLSDKISTLEGQAAIDQQKITDLEAKNAAKKTTIVHDYQTGYKEVAASCGLSEPSVNAINDLLSIDEGNTK